MVGKIHTPYSLRAKYYTNYKRKPSYYSSILTGVHTSSKQTFQCVIKFLLLCRYYFVFKGAQLVSHRLHYNNKYIQEKAKLLARNIKTKRVLLCVTVCAMAMVVRVYDTIRKHSNHSFPQLLPTLLLVFHNSKKKKKR